MFHTKKTSFGKYLQNSSYDLYLYLYHLYLFFNPAQGCTLGSCWWFWAQMHSLLFRVGPLLLKGGRTSKCKNWNDIIDFKIHCCAKSPQCSGRGIITNCCNFKMTKKTLNMKDEFLPKITAPLYGPWGLFSCISRWGASTRELRRFAGTDCTFIIFGLGED